MKRLCISLQLFCCFIALSCTQKNMDLVDIPTYRDDPPGHFNLSYKLEKKPEALRQAVARGFDLESKDIHGKTLLMVAAEEGYLDGARVLLELGADPNEPGHCIYCEEQGRKSQYDTRTPLHLAVEKGNPDMIRLLMEHGADVAAIDEYGNGAFLLSKRPKVRQFIVEHCDDKTRRQIELDAKLVQASINADLKEMEKILDQGADANRRTFMGWPPLLAASGFIEKDKVPKAQRFEAMELLLQHGADINFVIEQRTLLYAAIDRQDFHYLVPFLLEHGADPNIACVKERETPLHIAAKHGYFIIAMQLLDHGADINMLSRTGETPITYAANHRRLLMMEFLLARGADVNLFAWSGETPLTVGFFKNPYPHVKAFIFEKGPGINKKTNPMGYTYLHGAVANQEKELVEELIEKGADVNVNATRWNRKPPKDPKTILYRTPLHLAIRPKYTDDEILKLLLDHGARIDARDNWGMTPLHLAVLKQQFTATKLLIDRGAFVDAENYKGETPLLLAAWVGRDEIAEILIKAGAKVNAKDWKGNTPLHRAADENHDKISAWLIKAGADVNARDQFGNTPLHRAASKAAHHVAATLLEAGADINARNNEGKTPLGVARYDYTTNFLKEHGGVE